MAVFTKVSLATLLYFSVDIRIMQAFSSLEVRGRGTYEGYVLAGSLPRASFLSMLAPPSPEPQDDSRSTKDSSKADPLRDGTGIRASLYPTIINAIADALRFRASKKKDEDGDDMVFRVSETVRPLDVAMTAGQIASTAISRRQLSSAKDGMKLTPEEEQTVAGRIMGVVMRLDDLEEELFERVSEIDWIAQYDEWGTFGVVQNEDNTRSAVDERVVQDPLFCLSRAECLLAIFLQEVEVPQLRRVNETVPDDSRIDFLDADRLEVLLSSTEQL